MTTAMRFPLIMDISLQQLTAYGERQEPEKTSLIGYSRVDS
jgi:hypothetical protein